MAGLDVLAGRLRGAADDVKEHGAIDAAAAAGGAFLGQLKRNTPVRSGTLRRSERVNSVTGSGESASAVIGTHCPVYASFREHGGTIRAHDRPRGGWIGKPRIINGRKHGHHTLHWPGGGFPMEVTQVGSHYMARTVEWASGGGLGPPAEKAVTRILRAAGL